MKRTPLVGFPADTFDEDGHLYHVIEERYLRAVAEVSACVPMMIPALTGAVDLDAVLDYLDGVVVTGAASNVHPSHYGAQPTEDHEPYDRRRDDLALSLIQRCLARKIPLLCICRGLQELNVALGGSLEPELQRREGRLDHREPQTASLDSRFGAAHSVRLVEGGRLAALLQAQEIMVNSLHRQGISRLAESLRVEAVAPDGVIEAVSMDGAAQFVLGTQWHPEYRAGSDPHSTALFKTFGEHVREYHWRRQHG